jgi:hypothetical protein
MAAVLIVEPRTAAAAAAAAVVVDDPDTIQTMKIEHVPLRLSRNNWIKKNWQTVRTFAH